ncbi:MAG: hypothetical protein WB626_11455 [Bacteroidota bacterium]
MFTFPIGVRVHEFEYKDVPLPSLIEKAAGEETLSHAKSFTERMQLFVTTKRILVFNKTLLGSQHNARYFPIDSLSSVQLGYRSPFGLLIVAFLVVLSTVIFYANVRPYDRDEYVLSVFLWFLFAAVLVGIWYYLRSYVIVLRNNTATYSVFSRSAADLSKVLGQIDSMRIK